MTIPPPTQADVLNILTHGVSQTDIAFTIPANDGFTITVDGSTFRNVANAIVSGRVHLAFPPHLRPLSAGASAEYSTVEQPPPSYPPVSPAGIPYPPIPANTLRVVRLDRVEDRAILLHEAIHASLDLIHNQDINRWFDEAAGYVAAWLYILACRPGSHPNPRSAEIATANAAFTIARLIRSHRPHPPVPYDRVDALATAIRNSPIYAGLSLFPPRDG